jgi:2',3'-cyclic-nucleotide 2'-phosphodiesterase / 3'-nucleotidase / 5'-nucleotidase
MGPSFLERIRLGRAVIVTVLLAPLFPPGAARLAAQSRRVELTVAATTDVHGRLRGWDYYAGAPDPAHSLASAATIVDSARKANPDGVILVEGGDILQGNPLTFVAARVQPTPVHPVIAAMNVMRYDAAVLGNHEFNYGVPLLQKAMSQAGFPFLAANVVDAQGRPFVAPLTMVTRRGLRVAIVGGTTPGSMVWDREHLGTAGLTVTDIVPAVRAQVREARRRRADVVIVLLHSGLHGPASYDTVATRLPSENVAGRVATEIDGIDAVVFGHSHRELVDSTINGALVMQPRNWAGSVALGTLTLERQKGRWVVVERKGRAVRVAGQREHPGVLAAAARSHENTVAWVNTPVGRTAVAWRSDSARVSDQPITDLVNEVMRRTTGADLAATAAFSLDAQLEPGNITQAQLSRLYPYDNTLRAVRVSGAQLRAFLEHSARYFRTVGTDGRAANGVIDESVPGYNFDVLSGADYTIDLTKPVGSRITRLEVKGRAVQPTDSFTLALNNYRQGGGGGYAMLSGAPVVFNRDVDIRQLIIDEVRRAGTLDPAAYAQRNWTLEPAAARAQAYDELHRGRRQDGDGARAPAGGVGAASGAASSGARTLRVIAMSDFHAALRPSFDQGNNPVGGAVALSAAIRQAQRECVSPACEHVVIDAGDLFTGSPASDWHGGRPTVDVVNRLDVAAGALGNHEFDFGQDTLRLRLRELRHAVLGANVRGPDGRMPSWLRSDTIVVRNGLRVGIVGAAGTHTPNTASRRKVGALTFLDPLPVFVERMRALRANGAQVIVAVIHDGGRCERDRPTECSGSGITLGRQLAALGADRPDVYVMGHAHVNLTLDFDGMPAVEPTSNGRAIVVVDVPVDGGSARAEVRPVRGAQVAGADPQVDSIVTVSVNRVEARLTQPVATMATALRREGSQNAVGNLLADATRAAARSDVGMWNNGGLRADIAAGPLNYGGVHYVSPFGNLVARVRLRGRDLLALLEHTVDGGRPDVHVSGLTIEFDPSRPRGQRITAVRDAAGVLIVPTRIYTLAMNDFMVENDFREPLARAISTEFLTVRDIDMLAEYLRRQPQPVRGDATPRIRAIDNGSNP